MQGEQHPTHWTVSMVVMKTIATDESRMDLFWQEKSRYHEMRGKGPPVLFLDMDVSAREPMTHKNKLMQVTTHRRPLLFMLVSECFL